MWKKIRFYYWLIKGFVNKHKWILIPAAVIGAITFFQIPLILKYLPEPKQVHYVGRVGSYTLSNLPRDLQTKVSRGLTYIDEEGRPQPDLAKEWKILDEGKTYIFTLKDDQYWQDGSKVVASDIDYTINDVQSEVIDDYTISFKLEEPYAAFPSVLSQPLFKRQQVSYLQVVNQTKIIGTSNYEFKKLVFNGSNLDSLTLESDSERLIYRFYTTEQAALLAFKLAEVDELENFSSYGDISEWPNIQIQETVDYQQYAVIFFNTQNDLLTDKKVRQALTYAIPSSVRNDLRAISPISPKSWAYNPNVKPYDYSMETAQGLLDGVKTDFPLELTTTPVFADLAEQVKQSWEELGFTVQIRVVNLPDTNNYQALLIGQRIPHDPDQYLLWHSTQESNITHYQSAKVDKLLEDGRKELDQQARQQMYVDFQRFLVEDSPAAFLFFLKQYTIIRG